MTRTSLSVDSPHTPCGGNRRFGDERYRLHRTRQLRQRYRLHSKTKSRLIVIKIHPRATGATAIVGSMRLATDDEAEPLSRRPAYKWIKWTDGQLRTATKGVDFVTTSQQFASVGRAWASRNGFIWRATVNRADVVFGMTRKSPDPRECPGHEPVPGIDAEFGELVYCDGSCQ